MLIAEDNWKVNLLDANELNTLLIPALHALCLFIFPSMMLPLDVKGLLRFFPVFIQLTAIYCLKPKRLASLSPTLPQMKLCRVVTTSSLGKLIVPLDPFSAEMYVKTVPFF